VTVAPPPQPVITPSETPGLAPGQTSVNPQDQAEIIYIPAATFEMGLTNAQAQTIRSVCNQCDNELAASLTRHTVTLDAYWIYKTEVSNGMYQKCVQSGYCAPPTKNKSDKISNYYGNPAYENYPVVYVTWNAAEQYCQWAGGHLPTEAQWEYAARGPNGNLYPWGDQLPSPALANLADYIGDTQPVNSYSSGVSYFGLYNMSGNVWEWVFDWYRADYYQTNTNWVNPSGPNSGDIRDGDSLKAGRGGAYWITAGGSSAGLRDWYQVSLTGSAVGFRCAMNP
jgi:formylglycine-generating enzyme required for sulfatase activity